MPAFSSYEEEYSHTSLVERRIFEGELSIRSTNGQRTSANLQKHQPYGLPNRRSGVLGMPAQQESNRIMPSDIGALSKLLVVPLDIFCEIAAYLEPYDVLNLARSTRDLNNFLMSADSRPVWRVARNFFPGLPDCPPDLSEPEYARLLFETDTCHYCFKNRETRAYFAARARLCIFCPTRALLKLVDLVKMFPQLDSHHVRLLSCVPFHTHKAPRHREFSNETFYVSRVKSILQKYDRFRGACLSELLEPPSWYPTNKPEVYEDKKDRNAVELFIANAAISMEAVVKHAAEVDQWLVTYKQYKIMEQKAIVTKHQQILHKKLIELGHSEKDFPGDWDAEWEEIMSTPQTYTSDSWTSVLCVLEECIHRERERREEDERETRQAMREAELTTLFSGLSAKPFWMNHADFFNLPTIQSLLTQDNYSIPVTQELQDFARPSIRKDIVDYELDILNRLIHLVKASSREIMRGDPVASLSSPTVFFSCKCCSGTLLTYPALLCRNKYSSTQRVVNDHLSFNIEASDVAQRILSAMAMDSNVYFSDLEKQFQCLRCDETWSETLTWSALVGHFIQKQEKARRAKRNMRFGPLADATEDDHSFNDTLPAMILSIDQAKELEKRLESSKMQGMEVDEDLEIYQF